MSDSVEGEFTAWVGQMTGHLAARNRGLLPEARALVFTPARHGRSNSEASLPTASTSNSSRSSSTADSSAQNPSPGSSRSSSSLPYSGDSLLHNLGSATAPISVPDTDTESSGAEREEDDASQPRVKRSRGESFSVLVAVPETQEVCAAASARASTKRTRSEGAPAARDGLITEASVNVGKMVDGVPCRQELGLRQPGSEEPPSIASPAANPSPSSPDDVESPVAGSALSSPEEVATPGEAGQDDEDGPAPCRGRGRGIGAVAARLFDIAAQASSGDSEDDEDDLDAKLSGSFIKDSNSDESESGSNSDESESEPDPRAPHQQSSRDRSSRQPPVAVRRASTPLSRRPQRQPHPKRRLRKLASDSDSEEGS